MPRIPYVYPEIGESEIADTIRQRRKNRKLIGLDGVLLNAPSIALGYSQLLGAVRTKNSLEPILRELLILRVAALNCAVYEWCVIHDDNDLNGPFTRGIGIEKREQHLPIACEAGLTEKQIEWIRDISHLRTLEVQDRPQPPTSFPAVLRAALTYADCVTIDIKVPALVFAALKSHLNDQEIMEVTATIAAYNMVSRILVALDVEDMADKLI